MHKKKTNKKKQTTTTTKPQCTQCTCVQLPTGVWCDNAHKEPGLPGGHCDATQKCNQLLHTKTGRCHL